MSRAQKPAAAVRKVAPPVVPEIISNRHSGGSFSSGYGSFGQPDNELPPPPSPRQLPPSPGHDTLGVMYAGTARLPAVAACSTHSPDTPAQYTAFSFPTSQPPRGAVPAMLSYPAAGGKELVPHFHNHLYQHQHSDDGIDVQSPGRDSPCSAGSGSSSSGITCRNSTSSLDSGRASSAYDGKTPLPAAAAANRLSGQSYESGSGSSRQSYESGSGSSRQSYHSSSSSLGSLDRDDVISHLNVAAMLADGVKDSEVLNAWLTDLHFEEYYQLFAAAGYDMPTISRMTPEDLTAVGITRPAHRRKLKAEIARLNISDGLPDYIPDSLEQWLQLLRLGEYAQLLRAQGFYTVQQTTEITWEDLEEIGISRLGHQKKMTLAIKRAKDILTGKRVPSQMQHQYTTQEIAISGSGSPTESTYQQLRTFQQPQQQQQQWQAFSQYRPLPLPLQQVHVQVEPDPEPESATPGSRGEEPPPPPPPPAPQSQLQYLEQQRHLWRRPSPAAPDLTPTVVAGGGGTLPRARPSQPRPVAKIVASTREEPPPAPPLAPPPAQEQDDLEPPQKRYGSLPRDPLRRGERPPVFSTPQATPRNPGPAATPRRDSLRAVEAAQLAAARQAFPPPPLPLVVREGDASDTSDCESSSPATVRPARADSAASFKSTSSTESDSFPFANDNAGTIKQRAQRGAADEPPPGNIAAAKPGSGQQDVLTDIGSMLADLTDELDAMLELETDVK